MTKHVLPDGRTWVGLAISPTTNRVTHRGQHISNHACLKLTGWPLGTIRKRMVEYSLTVDEAANIPPASAADGRISPAMLTDWVKTYREWKAREFPIPPTAAEPPHENNHQLPVPQHRFKLEVTAVQPADISHLHVRLDRIEKLLSELMTEWKGSAQ